jgi:helicase
LPHLRHKRGSASGCAKYLSDELGLSPASKVISQLPTLDSSGTTQNLKACLSGGTAFHTTDLSREERSLVERSFREKSNELQVLASTTTLAAGINTPASTVILVEHEFPGQKIQPYTVAEYKNMAGRAGRLGFKEEGLSIMLAENATERNQLFLKYVLGSPEAISSSFSEDNSITWLIRLLAQVKQISRLDTVRLLTNTYGGYLRNRKNPNWQETMRNRIEQLIGTLLSHNLLEEQDGFIRLTQLGIVCGQSTLSFDSVIRVIDLLRRNGDRLTMDEIIILTQALPESDQRYTPLAKNEIQWQAHAQNISSNSAQLLRYYTEDVYTYSRRAKRVSIVFDWMAGIAIDKIEQKHTANVFNAVGPGDIRSVADMTRFNVRSVYQIAWMLLSGDCPEEKELEIALKRLEIGIPFDFIKLLDLPIPLERGDYLQLGLNGIKTVNDFWSKGVVELKGILGEKIDGLEKHRPQ